MSLFSSQRNEVKINQLESSLAQKMPQGNISSASSGQILTANGDGTATFKNGGGSYTLPTASASILGGVKIGSGISVDASGVISATGVGSSIAYNVKSSSYNAKGDGSTDDTSAIQSCINACSTNGDGYVYIPKGTFMINAVTSLNIPNNIRIVFEPQAVLKVIPNNVTSYNVFKLNGVSNVIIEGNGASIQGDRATHTTATAWKSNTAYALNAQVNADGFIYQCATAGTSGATSPVGAYNGITDGSVTWNYVNSGENGMLVNMQGATNVYIENLTCYGGWGDGFYIGGATNCENIVLFNCIADHNRRNGVSITNAKNVSIIGGEFKNTSGTDPQIGIDIEPNANCMIDNVNIKNVRTSNNLEAGIACITPLMKGGNYNCTINIEDWVSDTDGLVPSQHFGVGLVLNNNNATASRLYGQINVNRVSIYNPDSEGVFIGGWCDAPKLRLTDVLVYNGNTYVSSFAPDQSAFGMDYNSNDPTGVSYGDIVFTRCGVFDTRTTKITKYAFAFYSVSTRAFNNITIIDPIFEGITSTTGWLSWTMPSSSSGMVAKFNTPNVVNIDTSQTITGYVGQEILATAAITLTLPASVNCIGMEFLVRYGAASGTVTLAVTSGDTIINKGAAVTSVSLTLSGTFIKVRAIGNNQYIVVEQNIS